MQGRSNAVASISVS